MFLRALGHALVDTLQIAILLSWIGYVYRDIRKRADGILMLNAADHEEIIACRLARSAEELHQDDILTLKVLFIEEETEEEADGRDV